MPDAFTYQTRQAQGLCPECGVRPPFPGRSRCEACRQTNAAWWDTTGLAVARDAYTAGSWSLDLPGPRLLCCGRWHAIATMPLRVPCCGRRYLIETPVDV